MSKNIIKKLFIMERVNREKIVHKFLENPTPSHSNIAKQLKLSRNLVWRVIKQFKETRSIERKQGSGRKCGPSNPNLAEKSVARNPGTSQRERARRLGTSQSTIARTIRRAELKTYKAIKVPNRHDKQNLKAKKCARKLYDEVLTKFNGCIIDDETYVKVDQNQIPGQKFYIADRRLNVADKYKYVKVDKFGKKVLIWQAICTCSLRSRAFATARTLNSDIYMKECLQKRLLNLIKKHNRPTNF